MSGLHIRERWEQGQQNAQALLTEIQTRGYKGSVDLIRRYVQSWQGKEKGLAKLAPRHLSVKQAARLLLGEPSKLKEKATKDLMRLVTWDEEIEQAYQLAQAFRGIVRERGGRQGLEEWLKKVEASQIVEIGRFGKSLKRDEEAVVAGLSQSFSNAQVEGQINRVKLVKRSMFGRAKFDLLTIRVIAA